MYSTPTIAKKSTRCVLAKSGAISELAAVRSYLKRDASKRAGKQNPPRRVRDALYGLFLQASKKARKSCWLWTHFIFRASVFCKVEKLRDLTDMKEVLNNGGIENSKVSEK